MVIVQFRRRAGLPCWMLVRNFSARVKMPFSCASGTGACHSKKFMPMSKSSDQSAWVVTMPASIHRLPSRWSRMQKSPWLWRVMYSIGP